MSRPVADVELDPAIVPIHDDVEGDVDEWLSSLKRDAEPLDLDVTGAEPSSAAEFCPLGPPKR